MSKPHFTTSTTQITAHYEGQSLVEEIELNLVMYHSISAICKKLTFYNGFFIKVLFHRFFLKIITFFIIPMHVGRLGEREGRNPET
jgi:hypothetical protein